MTRRPRPVRNEQRFLRGHDQAIRIVIRITPRLARIRKWEWTHVTSPAGWKTSVRGANTEPEFVRPDKYDRRNRFHGQDGGDDNEVYSGRRKNNIAAGAPRSAADAPAHVIPNARAILIDGRLPNPKLARFSCSVRLPGGRRLSQLDSFVVNAGIKICLVAQSSING